VWREAKPNQHSDGQEPSGKAAEYRARIRDDPEGAFRLASGVVGTMAAAAVAWGAWQKHVRGELTWKVVGLWGGVLAAFGAGDYFLGQYVAKQSRK